MMNPHIRKKALGMLEKSSQVRQQMTVTPAYLKGFCKVAEDSGIDPNELMKFAGFWSDAWSYIREIPGALKEQFEDGTMLKNLANGAGRFVGGLAKGVTALPGQVAGLVGGLGSGIGSWAAGQGFGRGFGEGYQSWSDAVNNFGPGSWTLGNAQEGLDNYLRWARNDYAKTNGIDPTKATGLDRWALAGGDLAETAGLWTGETLAAGGAGKLLGAGGKAARGASAVAKSNPLVNAGMGAWAVNDALNLAGNRTREEQDLTQALDTSKFNQINRGDRVIGDIGSNSNTNRTNSLTYSPSGNYFNTNNRSPGNTIGRNTSKGMYFS